MKKKITVTLIFVIFLLASMFMCYESYGRQVEGGGAGGSTATEGKEIPRYNYDKNGNLLSYTYRNGKNKIVTIKYEKRAPASTGAQSTYHLVGSDKEKEDAKNHGAEDGIGSDSVHKLKAVSPIFKQPEHKTTGNGKDSLDGLISEAESFEKIGNENAVIKDKSKVQDLSKTIYNILLTVGIVASVLIGAIIGIKLMTSGVEEKAEYKKVLVVYVIGCLIVFCGFAIWKVVVNILQGMG